MDLHPVVAAQRPVIWILEPSLNSLELTAPGRLVGAPGIATRSKDATRGSWHRYWEQEATNNKGISTRSKKL